MSYLKQSHPTGVYSNVTTLVLPWSFTCNSQSKVKVHWSTYHLSLSAQIEYFYIDQLLARYSTVKANPKLFLCLANKAKATINVSLWVLIYILVFLIFNLWTALSPGILLCPAKINGDVFHNSICLWDDSQSFSEKSDLMTVLLALSYFWNGKIVSFHLSLIFLFLSENTKWQLCGPRFAFHIKTD